MRNKSLPWLVPGVLAGTFVPLVVLVELAWLRKLGANPISVMLNQLGFVAMVLLLGSLSCTPLRALTKWKWVLRLRKTLGVMGFVYALLHFLVYLGLDQFFNFKTIGEDISKRPFIIIGFVVLLLLVPLVATSTSGASRRLGKNWRRLHRLAYVIAPLVIVHFTMRMKADLQQPAVYAAVLATLYAARLVNIAIKRAKAPAWEGYRPFTVVQKVFETDQVCSFYLQSPDGKKLPAFKPGQYLTFKADLGEPYGAAIRCYSLSTSPHPDHYRISVKRVPDGAVSNFLHDRIEPGAVLEAKAPRGKFVVQSTGRRPLILVGGGIGVTPLMAMLSAFTTRSPRRPVFFFFAVRNSREHCFREQVATLAARSPDINVHVCYSAPLAEDGLGQAYHHAGHISMALLRENLPTLDGEYYVCGPAGMMSQLKSDLLAAGVQTERVHMEAFTAASMPKTAERSALAERLFVTFEVSGQTLEWDPKYNSLLELAEASGIEVECSCRSGNCGSCEVAINSGEVAYAIEPGADPDEDACLLCVTTPTTHLSLDA